jgi:hypothetical protein
MAFDLHITISESSPAGQAVQRVANAEHITPEQAVTRILTEAAKLQDQKTPAEMMLGAFSSDEDSAITDEAMKHVRAMRQTNALRDFGI